MRTPLGTDAAAAVILRPDVLMSLSSAAKNAETQNFLPTT